MLMRHGVFLMRVGIDSLHDYTIRYVMAVVLSVALVDLEYIYERK